MSPQEATGSNRQKLSDSSAIPEAATVFAHAFRAVPARYFEWQLLQLRSKMEALGHVGRSPAVQNDFETTARVEWLKLQAGEGSS